jgi:hypothetical protein
MATTANTAANTAIEAANIAIQAANTAQIAASQASVAAGRAGNVTNITVINPNAAGVPGSLQFASNANQLSASSSLVFDPNTSNLQVSGNLRVIQAIQAETLQLKSAIANGNIQAERIIAARIESLANLSVANRITSNVVAANIFVGNGSQLTGVLKQNNPTLTGNVSVPNVAVNGPNNAPVPLKLLVDQLALKANINSPIFTGNPTAPTLTNVSSSTNSIATTAFVQLVANTKANLSNVTLTNVSLVGNVFAPTLIANSNTNAVATTQFVQNQKINLNLSGTPTAPTPNANATSNQIATVSFARSSGVPSIILSRRIGTDLSFSVGSWVTIPFDTFDRNVSGALIVGNNFDLLAGTYVYNIFIPVHCVGSDTINSFYTRFFNVDTGFALQNISATSIGDWSTATITGSGQFTLTGTTTIALQGLQADSPTARIDGFAGYQSGMIQFYKIA